MRSSLAIAFLLLCVHVYAQEKTPGVPLRPLGTPFGPQVPADELPVFRVVRGQPYNTQRSVMWKRFEAECEQVLTNAVLLQELAFENKYQLVYPNPSLAGSIGGQPIRRLISSQRIPGKRFCLTNYPSALQPATGKKISGKAMQVGTINVEVDTLELWDYGTPYIPAPPTNKLATAAKPTP